MSTGVGLIWADIRLDPENLHIMRSETLIEQLSARVRDGCFNVNRFAVDCVFSVRPT